MMGNTPDADPAGEQIYLRKSRAASRATWYYLGAAGAFVSAFLGFMLAIIGDVGQLHVQFMTTLPVLLGIGLLIHGRSLGGAPEMVRVGPHGVTVQTTRTANLYRWEQMGWARIDVLPMSKQRYLVIYDLTGKKLTRIHEAFDDFDQLADRVINSIVEQDRGAAGVIQQRKGRRNAILMASISTVLLLVAVVNMVMACQAQRAERLLTGQAVEGEGAIVRRFVAPNGITKRLEYRVTGSDGATATRNAEVTPAYWASLEEATTVPIRYVPAEPGISRLREGEVVGDDLMDSPAAMYILSGIVGVMCLFFYVAAVLSWKGWDIDLDSKTHKLSIKRFGTGR